MSKMRGDFPLVESADLVRMIRTYFRVDTTPADVEKPTPEFVHAVFESFVNLLISPTPFAYSSIRDLQFQDLFVDGAQRNQFFNRLHSLLHRLRIKEFCYEDLLRPEKDRFIKQMSGVANFMRFRDERLNRLQSCEQTRAAIEEQRQKHEQNLKKKTVEWSRLKEAYEGEKSKASGLDLERQQKRQRCVQLTRKHDQFIQEHASMKALVNRSKDEMNAATFEFNRCMRECEEAQGLIVEPPDVIQEAIQTASQRLNETRDLTTKSLTKDSNLRNEIHSITKHGTDTRGDIEIQKGIKMCQDENKEIENKVKEVKIKLEQGNQAYQELHREVNKLKKDCENESEDSNHQKQQFELLQKELESALLQKESEKCRAEEKNLEVERTVVAQGNDKVQEIKQQSKAMKDRHVFVINRTLHNAKLLEDAFRSWMKTI